MWLSRTQTFYKSPPYNPRAYQRRFVFRQIATAYVIKYKAIGWSWTQLGFSQSQRSVLTTKLWDHLQIIFHISLKGVFSWIAIDLLTLPAWQIPTSGDLVNNILDLTYHLAKGRNCLVHCAGGSGRTGKLNDSMIIPFDCGIKVRNFRLF